MSYRPVPLVRLLLVLSLLFGQQQAVLHALDHDFQRIHAAEKDSTGHGDGLCTKCLAIAHLDHVDGIATPAPASAAYAPPRAVPPSPAIVRSTTTTFYCSRAPPASS